MGTFALGAGAALAPALAACSGHSSSPSTTPAGPPRTGGKLVAGTIQNPAGFDPYFIRLTDTAISENCYTSLIEYTGTTTLTPTGTGLRSWRRSADGRSAMITLRPGQFFQSGTPVTADDLVAMFGRAKGADGEQLSAAAGFLGSFDRVDDSTVKLTFIDPLAESALTDMLAQFHIVEKAHNDPDQLAKDSAGSGPFRMTHFNPGVAIDLEKFDRYYQDGLPYLDSITYQVFEDPQSMVAALQSGQIKVATYVTNQQGAALEGQYQIIDGGPLSTLVDHLTMCPNQAPYDNKLLRQAIAHCIDRDRIRKDVSFGFGAALYLPYNLSSPVYGTSKAFPEFDYDLDKAKALFQQSGAPPSGKAVIGNYADGLKILQIVQADLKKIGFNVKIDTIEQTTYTAMLRKGGYGLTVYGSGSNLLNPGAKQVDPSQTTTNSPLWGKNIPARYANGMRNAATAQSDEELATACTDIRQSLLDEAWNLGIRSRVQLFAADRSGQGFGVGGSSGHVANVRTWISA